MGYILSYRDEGLGYDEFSVIYDGRGYPNVLKYTAAAGLETGRTYSFVVQALNFNGPGPQSTPVEYTLCTAPTQLGPPILAAVTRTSMRLSWSPPESDGGCRVLSYALFLDDGAGGALASVDDAEV